MPRRFGHIAELFMARDLAHFAKFRGNVLQHLTHQPSCIWMSRATEKRDTWIHTLDGTMLIFENTMANGWAIFELGHQNEAVCRSDQHAYDPAVAHIVDGARFSDAGSIHARAVAVLNVGEHMGHFARLTNGVAPMAVEPIAQQIRTYIQPTRPQKASQRADHRGGFGVRRHLAQRLQQYAGVNFEVITDLGEHFRTGGRIRR